MRGRRLCQPGPRQPPPRCWDGRFRACVPSCEGQVQQVQCASSSFVSDGNHSPCPLKWGGGLCTAPRRADPPAGPPFPHRYTPLSTLASVCLSLTLSKSARATGRMESSRSISQSSGRAATIRQSDTTPLLFLRALGFCLEFGYLFHRDGLLLARAGPLGCARVPRKAGLPQPRKSRPARSAPGPSDTPSHGARRVEQAHTGHGVVGQVGCSLRLRAWSRRRGWWARGAGAVLALSSSRWAPGKK